MKIPLLLTLLCSILAGPAHAYTQEFSEAELQARLEKLMPLTREHALIKIVLSEPELDLFENVNRLSIKAHVEALVMNTLKGSGHAKLSGSISYHPDTGTFHLSQARLDELVLDNIPEQYQRTILQAVQGLISNTFLELPIYQLDDAELEQRLAKSFLRSVEVKDEKLFVTLELN